jgi:toxin ParE1/3/4
VAPESSGERSAGVVRLRIASTAKDDIEDLLAWSEERFGVAARERYQDLLARALMDIAGDVARPGVRIRPELGLNVFSYHFFFSREGATRRSGHAKVKVLRPRHFLVGRIAEPGLVDILRVLHDSMEVSLHLPDELTQGRPIDA